MSGWKLWLITILIALAACVARNADASPFGPTPIELGMRPGPRTPVPPPVLPPVWGSPGARQQRVEVRP